MIRKTASLAAIICMIASSPAYAQATRTWVSGVGDDANPCSRTAPCKTFAGAISKTATGGEINVIDPGGFGGVSINKSLTIDGQGQMAGVLVAGTNGITINGAGAVVNLRNLSINGTNSTIGNGIRIVNAAAVNIDNVRIFNFAGTGSNGSGIVIDTSTSTVRVSITNTEITNVGNHGILVQPTAGDVSLIVDHTTVSRATNSGIALVRNVNAHITNCNLSNNINGAGVGTSEATVVANIGNCVLSGNSFGIANGLAGASTVRVYSSFITGNRSQGVRNDAGSIISLGNNIIRGNSGNETPTQTITTQ